MESGLTLPELEKIVLLSGIFGITTDALLRDELSVGGVTKSDCSQSCAEEKHEAPVYSGILIKESVDDENIIDLLKIHKAELWRTESTPKYWTALIFSSDL